MALEITPNDILYYDTSFNYSMTQYHKIVLKKNFYNKDSLLLIYPISIRCFISNEEYFWSSHFHPHQPQPRLNINFRFNSECNHNWEPQEELHDSLHGVKVYFDDTCNSIDLLHMKNYLKLGKVYEKGNQYLEVYSDTAKFSHEYLFDPYYLNAIKESGIPIK